MATIELTPALLSMSVLAVTKDAVYLRLPRELQRESGGNCICGHCGGAGLWDALVVPTAPARRVASYVVHMPDGAVPGFLEYHARRSEKTSAIFFP